MDTNDGNPQPAYKQKPPKYFKSETDWMVNEGYAESNKVSLRNIAMRQILQLSESDKFDALVPYAALNLFDRFISRHELPKILEDTRDDLVLAADACLSLSWCARDKSFSYDEFVENFSGDRTLRKVQILMMEDEILKRLQWRMRVVTPIFFLESFVGVIKTIGYGIKRRTLNELVVQTQGDIRFTRFLPTVIAASALLTACRILFPPLYEKKRLIRKLSRYAYEDDLETCLKETYEMCFEKNIMLERDMLLEDWKHLKEELSHFREASSSISDASEFELESETYPHMDFKLKWMMEVPEEEH